MLYYLFLIYFKMIPFKIHVNLSLFPFLFFFIKFKNFNFYQKLIKNKFKKNKNTQKPGFDPGSGRRQRPILSLILLLLIKHNIHS